MRRLRYEYGAGPAHLLGVLASLAVAGWALAQALDVLATPLSFLLWLLGAVVVHDLVLYPLYSGLGAGAARAMGAGHDKRRLRVAALNHLRVPAILSGTAFLVFFPLVLGLDPDVFRGATGRSNDIYLERWLALTAVLFGGSALLYTLRARRAR